MDIIEKLTYFNLTRQEATLYLTLLAEGCLTGYEATKLTGLISIPIYTALALMAAADIYILLIGLSRVYLVGYYPTDMRLGRPG